MSFYSLVFTVPKNTLEENPYQQKLKISQGIIHQVNVLIPAGHKGLTGCGIDIGLHQIAPTNQNEWFHGSGVMFSYPEHVEVPDGVTELNLRGYNLDDTNNHEFVVAVGVLPADLLMNAQALYDLFKPFLQTLQDLSGFFAPPQQPGAG